MLIVQNAVTPAAVRNAIADLLHINVQRVRIASAYTTLEGSRIVYDELFKALGPNIDGIPKEIVTSFDYGLTEPAALDFWRNLPNAEVKVAGAAKVAAGSLRPSIAFHPKVFAFDNDNATANLFVGSANMTSRGLSINTEAGWAELAIPEPEVDAAFAAIRHATVDLTPQLVLDYAALDFQEFHGVSAESPPANGDWARKLPPNADAKGYFRDRDPDASESDADASSVVAESEHRIDNLARVAASRPVSFSEKHEISKTFSYLINDDGSPVTLVYTEEDANRLKRMMPLLTRSAWTAEMTVAAARAQIRALLYTSHADAQYGAIYGEIRHWVSQRAPPPPNLLCIHAALFEEEICLELLYSRGYLRRLQDTGLLTDFDDASIVHGAQWPLVEESAEFILKRRREITAARQSKE